MNIGEFVIRFDHILNLCTKPSQFYPVFQPVQTSFLSQLKRTLVCIISATGQCLIMIFLLDLELGFLIWLVVREVVLFLLITDLL